MKYIEQNIMVKKVLGYMETPYFKEAIIKYIIENDLISLIEGHLYSSKRLEISKSENDDPKWNVTYLVETTDYYLDDEHVCSVADTKFVFGEQKVEDKVQGDYDTLTPAHMDDIRNFDSFGMMFLMNKIGLTNAETISEIVQKYKNEKQLEDMELGLPKDIYYSRYPKMVLNRIHTNNKL